MDFGPCAFLDRYDPDSVFSSIDHQGRYAYRNQPRIAPWNLACLAEALLPLLAEEAGLSVQAVVPEIKTEIDQFAAAYDAAWLREFRAKLGLRSENLGEDSGQAADRTLIEDFLKLLQKERADFTLSFRELAQAETVERLSSIPEGKSWFHRWQDRFRASDATTITRREQMLRANPAVIARNFQVERALKNAEQGDLTQFEALLKAVREPWTDHAEYSAAPPEGFADTFQTFCGT